MCTTATLGDVKDTSPSSLRARSTRERPICLSVRQGSKLRYVDKDFTKVVHPHAIYPLKLNVTNTFTSQVKKQEHFIQWADWTKDMNYLLAKGAVGRMIDMNHGPKYLNVVQEYVNDVGSPQSILDDIDRIGSKIISNAAGSQPCH